MYQDERANNHQKKEKEKTIYKLIKLYFIRNNVKLLIVIYLISYCYKFSFNILMLKNDKREINQRVRFILLIRQIKIIKTDYNNN